MGSESTFLYHVAHTLWEHWGADGLGHSMIFLPSARAKLYFVRYLYELSDKRPLTLPLWGDIRRETERIAGIRIVDPLVLLPRVYDFYYQLSGQEASDSATYPERLVDFYHAGMTILRDFDQVDKYLVDAHDLFGNLSALTHYTEKFDFLDQEQIAILSKIFSNIREHGDTPITQKFAAIWHILSPLYDLLQAEIRHRGEGYEGAVFRTAVTKLQNSPNANLLRPADYVDRFAVVGFNALNACETEYFQHLKGNPQGLEVLFYWNLPHEFRTSLEEGEIFQADHFVKRNVTLLGGECISNTLKETQEVEIIATPSVLSQTTVASNLLTTTESTTLRRSVLILPDEHLLLPLLQALPPELGTYNITMGYPLRNTLVFSLLQALLHWLAERDVSKKSKQKSLQSLLSHPFLIFSTSFQEDRLLVDATTEEYITDSKLGEESPLRRWLEILAERGIANLLVCVVEEIGEWLESEESIQVNRRELWLQYLLAGYEALKTLQKLFVSAKLIPTVRWYQLLLSQVFGERKIDFYGEPLQGLQIMGFLETRCLDFDEVTILSCNEGVLPAVHTTPSFIMTSLSRLYKLPTMQEREAMYAYYFQTVISRAKKVRLIYAKSESWKNGEPSRYILEMLYNLGSSQRRVEEVEYSYTPRVGIKTPPQIPLEQKIRVELEQYFAYGVSPTALGDYCACPLLFYYKHIAKWGEREEPEHVEPSPLEFGNLLHNTLYALYSGIVGKPLNEGILHSLKANIEATLSKQFEKIFGHAAKRGVDAITCEIVKKIVSAVIEKDMARARENTIEVFALEKELSCEVILSNQQIVRLRGVADRIDRVGGRYYVIIDYKTGLYNPLYVSFKDVASLFTPEVGSRMYVFQTFFYSYLLSQSLSLSAENITPALWFVMEKERANLEILDQSSREPLTTYAPYAQTFAERLQRSLETLFGSKTFEATSEQARCSQCTYRELCYGDLNLK